MGAHPISISIAAVGIVVTETTCNTWGPVFGTVFASLKGLFVVQPKGEGS